MSSRIQVTQGPSLNADIPGSLHYCRRFPNMNLQVLVQSCELLLTSLEEVLKAESVSKLSRQNAYYCFNGCTEVNKVGTGAQWWHLMLNIILFKKKQKNADAMPGLPSEDVCHCFPHCAFIFLASVLDWVPQKRHLEVELKRSVLKSQIWVVCCKAADR